MNNQELSVYDNAKHWVAQYEAVDDVKEFIDKTAAIQEYARRSNDMDMEIKAAKARVRAEKRCGELLRDMEKAKGAKEPGTNRGKATRSTHETTSNNQHQKEEPVSPRDQFQDKPKTLSQLGLTKDQSSKYQKLAEVPEKVFEEILEQPASTPSANYVLGTVKAQNVKNGVEPDIEPVNLDALYFWGETGRYLKRLSEYDPDWLVSKMTPTLREEMKALVPELKQWLEGYHVSK